MQALPPPTYMNCFVITEENRNQDGPDAVKHVADCAKANQIVKNWYGNACNELMLMSDRQVNQEIRLTVDGKTIAWCPGVKNKTKKPPILPANRRQR